MKKLACVVFVFVAVGLVGANLISQSEAIVSGTLADLKFEAMPAPRHRLGAPPQFRVTKETIKFLQKLENEKKVIEVQANGAIKIKER